MTNTMERRSDPALIASPTFRILLVSNLYPPHVKGGAELACAHLAAWLAGHGQEVGVLTLAPPGEPESTLREANGVTIFRRQIPNVYHTFDHLQAAGWKKPLWHLIDHFNPVAVRKLSEVLEEFRPDVVNTHHFQGMGYNLWKTLATRGLPVLVTLHDLGLKCLRQSMFKNGLNCATQCLICKVSSNVRGRYVGAIERLRFVSPSQALLRALEGVFPPQAGPGLHLPNPLSFPTREEVGPTGTPVRLLYVGQVSTHKGVPFLLEALSRLRAPERFQLTVVGRGQALESLQAQYADAPWVRFSGFVPPEQVESYMRAADLLLVPSLWYENQPLVVLQARALGLPLLVSDRGGLPELVEPSFGRVLPAGDSAAWLAALDEATGDPALLDRWKEAALRRQDEFAPDRLGKRYLAILQELTQPCRRG